MGKRLGLQHAPPCLDLDGSHCPVLSDAQSLLLFLDVQAGRGPHLVSPPQPLQREGGPFPLLHGGVLLLPSHDSQGLSVSDTLLHVCPAPLDGRHGVQLDHLPCHLLCRRLAAAQLTSGQVAPPRTLDLNGGHVLVLRLLLVLGAGAGHHRGVRLTGLTDLVVQPLPLDCGGGPLLDLFEIPPFSPLFSLLLHAPLDALQLRCLVGDMHLPRAANVRRGLLPEHGVPAVVVLLTAQLHQLTGEPAALRSLERGGSRCSLRLQHQEDCRMPGLPALRDLLPCQPAAPRALDCDGGLFLRGPVGLIGLGAAQTGFL
mmetsp:Transcript_56497/g.100631  ORF Transcript_56497/g.100631 Transcript_56497/m.100631 type:complete len:314 (+) Transcript_56497:2345-3286(+)